MLSTAGLAGCRVHIYAICFLTGAVTVQGTGELPSPWYSLVSFVLFVVGVRFRWLLPLAFISCGSSWAAFHADALLDRSLPQELERKELQLDAVVTSLVDRNERYLKFTVNVEALSYRGQIYPSPGKVRLSWRHAESEVGIGQKWRFRARLKRPHGFQNPGGFDYEKWLFRQGIRATGYVLSAEPVDIPRQAAWWGPWREAIQLDLAHSGRPFEGLLRALSVGDRSGVSRARWDVLQRTGTVHLLAISGLHIGLVAGFGFILGALCARLLGSGLLRLPAPKAGAVAAVVGGGIYALLAGLTVPTQRATVMVAALMLALLVNRSLHITRSLVFALLVVLVIDPLSVLDTGFWLSFCAVTGIVLALRLTAGSRSRLMRLVTVQLVLTVVLAPLILWFYGRVSLTAPLANLVAIPVVGFAIVPLTLGGALASVLDWSATSGTLFGFADTVTGLLWRFLATLSQPGWAVWQQSPTAWTVAIALAGLSALFYFKSWCVRLPALACAVPIIMGAPNAGNDIAEGEFTVTVLDVGQGLSTVVRTRGSVMVYDTGARFSPRFDAGRAVVVPYLRHLGMRRIDKLVISHGDNDHIGGLDSILDEIETGPRLTSVPQMVPLGRPCVAGQAWVWDGVRFEMLGPLSEDAPGHNNSSCVLSIRGAFGTALLTGDIGREVERRLVSSYAERLLSDVLLVPHQGSNTSSSNVFIDAVAPRIALVSSGYLNRYGHPAAVVVERYRTRGIPFFNTATEGALTVYLGRRGTFLQRYRTERHRYWFDG